MSEGFGDRPVCVVHISENGDETYSVFGAARMLIIDERAPHDRIYEISSRMDARELAALIGESEIGHAEDERHEAIAACINAAIDGRKHLSIVSSEKKDRVR